MRKPDSQASLVVVAVVVVGSGLMAKLGQAEALRPFGGGQSGMVIGQSSSKFDAADFWRPILVATHNSELGCWCTNDVRRLIAHVHRRDAPTTGH